MGARRPIVRRDPTAEGILKHAEAVFREVDQKIRDEDPELDHRIEARRRRKRLPKPSA